MCGINVSLKAGVASSFKTSNVVRHYQFYRQTSSKTISFQRSFKYFCFLRGHLKSELDAIKKILADTNLGCTEHFQALKLYRSTNRRLRSIKGR